jgi:hypothetical protein
MRNSRKRGAHKGGHVEAGEQRGAIRSGVGGPKGWDQGNAGQQSTRRIQISVLKAAYLLAVPSTRDDFIKLSAPSGGIAPVAVELGKEALPTLSR